MTIFIPGTIGKGSLESVHPFLTQAISILNSCSFQYHVSLVKYAKGIQ